MNYLIVGEDISLLSINTDIDNNIKFKIILNSNSLEIGEICLCFYQEFSYRGNIYYFIKEEYRNKHYATQALNLLKKNLNKENDIYVATTIENIASQHVAINSGGVLIYDDIVPRNDSLYYIENVNKVKIYKIKIESKE